MSKFFPNRQTEAIKMKFKRPARNLSVRKRFMALVANEKVVSKHLAESFFLVTTKLCNIRLSFKLRLHGLIIQQLMFLKYLQSNLEPEVNLNARPEKRTRIEEFTEDECWTFFETRKVDLHRLKNCLRMPDTVIFNNRQRMLGETVFLRGLYELVSGEDQENIALNVFGRDQPSTIVSF